MDNRGKGRLGEQIAADYLQKKKIRLIAKNFFSSCGEIDIIAMDKANQELVFVEVKTRTGSQFGYAEDAVDQAKLEKIFKTANRYMQQTSYLGSYRFDCVAIELNFEKRQARIRHYQNIEL